MSGTYLEQIGRVDTTPVGTEMGAKTLVYRSSGETGLTLMMANGNSLPSVLMEFVKF